MKKKLKVYIQGEVIIRELAKDRKPEAALNTTGIVATGETGNHHQLIGGRFSLYGNALAAGNLLRVEEATTLVHGLGGVSGHEMLVLPPGTYEVLLQREQDLLSRLSHTVLD